VMCIGARKAFLSAVKPRHAKIHTIQSDIADPNQIAALAARVKADFPSLDVLMNNAGVGAAMNLAAPASDLAALTSEVDINFGGVIRMISALIDVLTANRGTIINVSSGLAFVPLPSNAIYSATKAAVHSYTQSLRFQLESSGVEVIELMHPAVKTDMTSEFDEAGISMITTDELVKQTFTALRAGKREIHPGQSKQLAFLGRVAPNFINRQLWKATKELVPGGRSHEIVC